jgi:hypothetical protein
MASQQRWWRLPKSNTNGNLYADSNSDADGNLYAYSDINAYNNGHPYSYRGTEDYAYAKATAHTAATPLSSKISCLDSGTRERTLASSYFIDRTHSPTLIRIQLCEGREHPCVHLRHKQCGLMSPELPESLEKL